MRERGLDVYNLEAASSSGKVKQQDGARVHLGGCVCLSGRRLGRVVVIASTLADLELEGRMREPGAQGDWRGVLCVFE